MQNYYNIKDVEFNLTQVKWFEVRDEVYRLNPKLAETCDNINKHAEYSLFKVSYPYGAYIVNQGEFFLPTIDGKMISIKDKRIPEFLKKS